MLSKNKTRVVKQRNEHPVYAQCTVRSTQNAPYEHLQPNTGIDCTPACLPFIIAHLHPFIQNIKQTDLLSYSTHHQVTTVISTDGGKNVFLWLAILVAVSSLSLHSGIHDTTCSHNNSAFDLLYVRSAVVSITRGQTRLRRVISHQA